MIIDFIDVLCIHYIRFARTKHPLVIAPLIPLTFVVGYQADMAWGNKMERVIGKNKHHTTFQLGRRKPPPPYYVISIHCLERAIREKLTFLFFLLL